MTECIDAIDMLIGRVVWLVWPPVQGDLGRPISCQPCQSPWIDYRHMCVNEVFDQLARRREYPVERVRDDYRDGANMQPCLDVCCLSDDPLFAGGWAVH